MAIFNASKSHRAPIFFAFLLIFIATTNLVSCYSWHSSTELWDLESNDASFASEVSPWYATNLVTSGLKYSVCGSYYVMGGYNILAGDKNEYFQRTFTGLSAHNQLNLTYLVLPIDSWDGTTADDHYEVYVDGYYMRGWLFSAFAGYATQVCGGSWAEFPPVRAYSTFVHSASSVTIRFINMLDQGSTDESLGIREVQLNMATMASPQYSLCGRSNGTPLPDKACPCSTTNQYMNPPNSGTCFMCHTTCATCDQATANDCLTCYPGTNRYLSGSTCALCNSACATCFGGAISQCNSCISGYFLVGTTCYPTCNYPLYSQVVSGVTYCRTPCPSNYAYWDGTCGTCAAPLQTAVSNTFNLCTYPCLNTQSLYWNGTCGASCLAPLSPRVTNGKNFCDYPCAATGQYLYWNGSCLGSCPSPLNIRTEGTPVRSFCDYKCAATGQYLYWNGTCGSSCPSPLVTEVQGNPMLRNFCWYPCAATGQYLYWNGSCISSCPSPLTIRTEGSPLRSYCDYKCATGEFLYWNGTCGASCPFPLSTELQGVTIKRNFCWYPCAATGQYLYWNGSCITDCAAPLTIRTEGTPVRNYCDYKCGTSQYLYWNGSCLNTCPDPLSSEVQGLTIQRNFCWYTCAATGQFLYWNKSCIATCSFPLSTRTEGTPVRSFCDYPCSGPSQYLYWNGTCTTCSFPLSTRVEAGKNYCDYLCSPSQWLYWNGTCGNSCPVPPFATRIEGSLMNRNFCDYPCQTTEWLYWNGVCKASCDFPLVQEYQGNPIVRDFCKYPCGAGQWLYWNGTCGSSCLFPLTQRTTDGRQFCDYSCGTSQFLYWNGTCGNACDSPLATRTEGTPSRNFCDYPCFPSEYLLWNGSCFSSCDIPLALRVEGTPSRNFCDYRCLAGEYLYWNGTCLNNCNLPLIVRVDAGKPYCDYLCPASQIIYWDGMCSSSCAPPLVLQNQGSPISRNFCYYPCPVNQILYWNGTCSAQCKFPLVSYAKNSRQFCKYPCLNTEFLYWNGTCGTNCNGPLSTRVEAGKNYCDYPCAGTGQYLYWNGSCISSCLFPLTARNTSGNLYCDFSCATSTNNLYWNGTCSATCLAPLSQRIEGSPMVRRFCGSNCLASEYLYWNGSCSSSCDSPLSWNNSMGVLFCNYPCATSQFLYWNTSCLGSCPFPLATKIEASRNYCNYPCEDNEYLYWNGTCAAGCDSPLASRTENGKKYCDFSCADQTDYLYDNGTCSDFCEIPLASQTVGTVLPRKFCTYPCQSSEFLFYNTSCVAKCPKPYRKIVRDSTDNYCFQPCENPQHYYYEEMRSCLENCTAPRHVDKILPYLRCQAPYISQMTSSLFNMFLYAPIEPGTLTVVNLVKVMQYVRYLDIKMPPRLERLGISRGRNILSVRSGIKMRDSLKGDFIKHSLPEVFAKHNLHSSFLVNYWEDIMTLAVLFLFAFLFVALERLNKFLKQESLRAFFKGLRVICKWNIILMYFATGIDDIVLYLALEFKSFKADTESPLPEVSFVVGFAFLAVVLVLFGGTYWLIYKLNKIKSSVVPENFASRKAPQAFENLWEGFQVLFRGFRDTSIYNQMFFLLYVLRIGFPMFIVVLATSSPMTISVSQVLLSVGMLWFLLKMQPFKKRINHYQILIFESVVLMMNICMFILTVFDAKGHDYPYASMLLGDIVIVGNDCINIMCLGFLVIKLKIEADEIIKKLTKKAVDKPREVSLWVQLLALPFQQGNMGFEEMIGEDSSVPPRRIIAKPTTLFAAENSSVLEKAKVLEEDKEAPEPERDLRTRIRQKVMRIQGKNKTEVDVERPKTIDLTEEATLRQEDSARKTPDSSLINLNQDSSSPAEIRQLQRRRNRSTVLSTLFAKRAQRLQEEGAVDNRLEGDGDLDSPIFGQKTSQLEITSLTGGTTYPYNFGEAVKRKQSSDYLMSSLNTASPAAVSNRNRGSRLLLTKVQSIEENSGLTKRKDEE